MGAFCGSVPGGTTSMTGASSKFTPAESSCRPQLNASAWRVGAGNRPWANADGIREKPGPCKDWI